MATSEQDTLGMRTAAARQQRLIYIVLPAYNEAEQIRSVILNIDEALTESGLSYKILIIDDGSTDGTAAIATRCSAHFPVDVQSHSKNQGLGMTLRDGLLWAVERATDRDIIVTMDADNTHTPGTILHMVHMLTRGYDVVIASRYERGSRTVGVPFNRRLLSRAASILLRTLFPTPGVKDYTCGYRAYRAAVLRGAAAKFGDALFDQAGFQCMIDLLLKLRTMPVIIGEVPFLLRYDIKAGATKMRVLRTIKDSLALIVKRRFFDRSYRTP